MPWSASWVSTTNYKHVGLSIWKQVKQYLLYRVSRRHYWGWLTTWTKAWHKQRVSESLINICSIASNRRALVLRSQSATSAACWIWLQQGLGTGRSFRAGRWANNKILSEGIFSFPKENGFSQCHTDDRILNLTLNQPFKKNEHCSPFIHTH